MLLNFEHLKTFYSALKQKMKNFRGNWNQNDPTADDYIKNRPFYSEGAQEVTILHYTVDTDAGSAPMISAGPARYNISFDAEGLQPFIVDQEYSIKWNNKTYTCKAKLFEDIPSLGDTGLVEGYADTGEPFLIAISPEYNSGVIITTEAGRYPITVTMRQEIVHKLDKKFIDIPDNLVTTEMLEETVAGSYSEGLEYYLASDGYWVSGIGTCTDIDIIIPSVINGHRVVGISESAFQDRRYITNIVIPNSVMGIGSYAFSGCGGMVSITIPDSVTSIGNYAFQACQSLTNITIPKGITNIYGGTFYLCYGLTSITIPNNVISIGDYAFSYCKKLTSVTIPNSVTMINEKAFIGSDNLTIYCEAKSQPDGWNIDWNSGNRPVVWGAALDLPNVNDKLNDCATTEYVDNAVANAGGASSWNDLTDKPFGETIPPIAWDGNIEGREPAEGIQGYKVSDQFIEPETFVGAVFTLNNGDTYIVQEDDVNIMSDGTYTIAYAPKGIGAVLCTPNDAIESKGLYLYCWPNSQEYLAKIEFPVKTLDEKYIPDTIARMSDIQTMIGDAIGGSY